MCGNGQAKFNQYARISFALTAAEETTLPLEYPNFFLGALRWNLWYVKEILEILLNIKENA